MARKTLAAQGAAERRKRDSQIRSAQGGRHGVGEVRSLAKAKAKAATAARWRKEKRDREIKKREQELYEVTTRGISKGSRAKSKATSLANRKAPSYKGTNASGAPQKRSAASFTKHVGARRRHAAEEKVAAGKRKAPAYRTKKNSGG